MKLKVAVSIVIAITLALLLFFFFNGPSLLGLSNTSIDQDSDFDADFSDTTNELSNIPDLPEQDNQDSNSATASTVQSVSYSIELPLVEEDFYEGKFTNATAALLAFQQEYSTVYPSSYVALISNNLLWFTEANGYVNTQEGFAFGACWFVTALGGLVDETNEAWQSIYGYELFNVTEAHPHGKQYPTYFPNNGYGYAVYRDVSGGGADYKFHINPLATNVSYVEFSFIPETDNPAGYQGLSVSGTITIFFK